MKPTKKPDALVTFTVLETGELWVIREVERLHVVGVPEAVANHHELIVIDPDRREILLPNCYDTEDFGSAIIEAIDISSTQARRAAVAGKEGRK